MGFRAMVKKRLRTNVSMLILLMGQVNLRTDIHMKSVGISTTEQHVTY